MAELELVHTKTKRETEVETVEVEFPIYSKRGYNGYAVYTKVNEDKTAIRLKIVEDGENDGVPGLHDEDWFGRRYVLASINKYAFEANKGLDYCLGKGAYELSAGEFTKVIREFRDFADRIINNEN